MSADATSPDRYAWPAVSEEELALTCSRIARHMSRAKARIIGLLPVGGPAETTMAMTPFLSRIGQALSGFVDGDVALVDAWPTWADGAPDGPAPASRFREVHPHMLEVAPPPCADAMAATAALQRTVDVLRRGVAVVLIHLGGYAPAGIAPPPLLLVDGVVMMVARRRARRSAVAELLEHVAPAKRVGAILVG